uniref:HlyD family efflux transporter periplasmic adaptor subunit n=1 Tax=Eubacterium sp. TaxID=142586 RepID=UPI0040260023
VQLYSAFNVSLKTQTALQSTVYETVDTTALVVRDEQVVQSSGSAVTVSSVDDCEKVYKGGEIALTFDSQEAASAYSQYVDLEDELRYYSDMESQSVGQATDVESLDSSIIENINEYVRAAAVQNVSEVTDNAYELNDRFTRRQILIGKDIDFSSVMREIEDKMSALNINSNQPTGSIKAEESGIYSEYTDSLEGAFDYDNIDNLSVDTFESWVEQAQNAETAQGSGKIITDFEWYFCAEVSVDDVKGLENGDRIDVAVSGTDSVYSCKIVSGAQPELGQEKTVLVLSCDDINSDTVSMRLANIEIRVNSYTGIRVPSAAVHVNNGERGVYALVASVVEWRSADVLYTDGDYVVLSYDPDSENGIKLYDQI